jgi:hypothetical protein
MFVPADKITRDKGTAEPRCTTACVMCGQPSEPICWECLASTIEVVVERMAREGKLDDVMQRVIERMRG